MLGIKNAAAGGGGGSSATVPVGATRRADDLSNAVRVGLADRVIAMRPWSRAEWEALPAACRPAHAIPTPDGRYYVAADLTDETAP